MVDLEEIDAVLAAHVEIEQREQSVYLAEALDGIGAGTWMGDSSVSDIAARWVPYDPNNDLACDVKSTVIQVVGIGCWRPVDDHAVSAAGLASQTWSLMSGSASRLSYGRFVNDPVAEQRSQSMRVSRWLEDLW